MILSKYTLESLGYTEHSSEDELKVKFNLVRVYSIQGFNLTASAENEKTKTIQFADNCKAAIGNNVNSMANTLFNDDLVEDEEIWMKEQKALPPFLFLYFGPTELYKIKGGFRKFESKKVSTYNCFPEVKNELKIWEKELLPSIITSVSVKFSSLDILTNLVPVFRVIFGETSTGMVLHDWNGSVSFIENVSTKVDLNQVSSLLLESSELNSKLSTKISRLFYMGLDEDDRYKKFLYFSQFIERYTHSIFKNIYHDKHFQELLNAPSHLKETKLECIKEWHQVSTNLAQRFYWCSFFIWKNITDEDIKKFKIIKSARNSISHGEDYKEAELPVKIARELASKLLNL